MGNYILLCHGGEREYSSFDVPSGSEVIYWGTPGYALPADVAYTAISQIRKCPTDLESINRYFEGLPPLEDRILIGNKTYGPDFNLQGADDLLCIFINLNTNEYAILTGAWTNRLSNITSALSNDVLHLLCCTGENPNPSLKVLDNLVLTDPDNIIPS